MTCFGRGGVALILAGVLVLAPCVLMAERREP